MKSPQLFFSPFLSQPFILQLPLINHFTGMSLVPWPFSEREADVDLVLIKTSLLFS